MILHSDRRYARADRPDAAGVYVAENPGTNRRIRCRSQRKPRPVAHRLADPSRRAPAPDLGLAASSTFKARARHRQVSRVVLAVEWLWMLRVMVAVMVAMLAVGATPPPQIYRVVTRPLCAELHERIAPAIGMMMQNDTTIKKSPQLFKRYNDATLYGADPAAQGSDPVAGDPGGATMNPSQNMALQGMESLIRPIANNIIAIQTMLDSPELRTARAARRTTSDCKQFARSCSRRLRRRTRRSISSAVLSIRSRWPICSMPAKHTSVR